jgi:hypothetical protein
MKRREGRGYREERLRISDALLPLNPTQSHPRILRSTMKKDADAEA